MTGRPAPASRPADAGGGEGVGVEGRELAALVDGPWSGCWYWRDDLERQQAAARAVHARGGTAQLGDKAHYQPTDQIVPSPAGERRGRAWSYQPAVIPAQRDGQRPAPRPVGGRRMLVTGSRTWTDTGAIRAALAEQWGDGTAVLVTGACPTGADRIAEQVWSRWGGRVERHPADWSRYGRAAGPRRNAELVAAGAHVCLAFIRAGSPGASHTARLAETAGIPTHRHTR